MKIFVVILTVLLDLIHAADGATNDTTAVKPSRPPLIVAVERGDRGAVEKLLRIERMSRGARPTELRLFMPPLFTTRRISFDC